MVRAVLAVGVMAVLAEGMAFLLYVAASGTKPSKVVVARLGGAVFYAFHRVGFVVEVPRSALSGEFGPSSAIPLPLSVRATATVALMGGTVAAVWLLWLGGKAVARRTGGNGLVRGLHGAKIGLPYGLICLAGAWGVRFAAPIGGGRVQVHPSYVAAFLWPLGLGVLAGFSGGFRSPRQSVSPELPASQRDAQTRRLEAVVAGGWLMTILALALSFAGLVVLAVVKPDATRAYFHGAFRGGPDNGIATIAANLLILPNLAAWVLFPAMGSCVGVSGASLGLNGSVCFLSYTRFPSGSALGGLVGGAATPTGLPHPPPGYYAFVLAPLLAVLIGGMAAARRSRPETLTDAVGVGAFSGFVFGLLASLAVVLANVTLKAGGRIGGAAQDITLRVGPQLTKSILVAFVWGVAGGAVGGFLQGRRLASARPGAIPFPGET